MSDAPVAEELEKLSLFAGLSGGELNQLCGVVRQESVASDVLVVTQADPTSEACVVLSGMLKVYIERPDGSDVVLAMLGPGEVIGELNLIDHLGRSANVVSTEASTLLWLDESALRDHFVSVPRLAENLLAILARRLRLANAQIQALTGLSIQGRIAHQLVAFADAHGTVDSEGNVRIHPPLSPTDLAGMVGADPVHVKRILSAFSRNLYLSVSDNNEVTIRDHAALAKLCL